MKPSNTTSGKSTDMIAGIYMYIPSFALPIYKTTCHAKPYLCCCCCCCRCCCCYCTAYCWLVLLGVFLFFFQLSCEIYMEMDVVQNPQKCSGYDQGTTIAGWSCSVFYFSFQVFCESYMVVDVVVQNPQKSNVYEYEKKTCTS